MLTGLFDRLDWMWLGRALGDAPAWLVVFSFLSSAITFWQFFAAFRFPLHRSTPLSVPTDVTILKPLKGQDEETFACLQSWCRQKYSGRIQILFGAASVDDPVCGLVRRLLSENPTVDAELIICSENLGPNAKVSTLVQLERRAKYAVIVVSDADVHVEPDLLSSVVAELSSSRVGLAHCFYALANPSTLAMRLEAIGINSDFWSQVLQARSLKQVDFALGAVMAIRNDALKKIGGFQSLLEYLADDYQLGNRIVKAGYEIAFCGRVVDCRESPKSMAAVWRHQLRWARTIRACQPGPFFLSIIGNATLWPLLLLLTSVTPAMAVVFGSVVAVRMLTSGMQQQRLTRSNDHWPYIWLAPLKDVMGFATWFFAFLGNIVEWRGIRYRVLRGGKLYRIS